MKLIVLIIIAVFLPDLLPLILFYWGIAFSIERFSFAPRGFVDAITYRIVPGMIVFAAGIFFVMAIVSGEGTIILILLVLALIAAYRGGLLTQGRFSLRSNVSLPTYRTENKNTVSTGRDYELFIKNLIKEQGWNVVMTVQSGDQGADLIAEKNGTTIAIQCKWLSRGRVGNTAVQEIFAALAYYNCLYGCVVTNADYTNPAIDLAERTGVILLHHNELPRFLMEVRLEQGEIIER